MDASNIQSVGSWVHIYITSKFIINATNIFNNNNVIFNDYKIIHSNKA